MIKQFKKLLFLIIASHLILTSQSLAIRVVEQDKIDESVEGTTLANTTQSNYRKTVAKVQESLHRVPDHLQFIPPLFIYESADDVIHVIDPPKHFEELKKVMQHQEQYQMHNQRPIALRQQGLKAKFEKDLDTQGSQHLPLEILASVRKTEKYLKKHKPKLPLVKQRLKTKKIQTVIWENSHDEQQYQHGQERRVQGIREQPANRRRFTKNRFKREVFDEYQPLKGEQLLNHINELINNASFYLQQTENYGGKIEAQTEVGNLDSTTLKGEIIKKVTKTPATNSTLNGDMIVKILENSVKATNVIMQEIKSQTNLTTISEKCDYLKVTYPNHIQNLQNQIKCMQNFIKDINQYQQYQPPTTQAPKEYGDRSELRKTKDLKHKPFLVAQLTNDNIDDTATSPVNNTLIYDDVMTTIRNMLQSKNLQSIEDTTLGSSSLPWRDFFINKKSLEPVDFYNLQGYLSSLQTIASNLPKFTHKTLNLQEIENGSTSKYYFINPQATIYDLPHPFQKDTTTPASSITFRQLTDFPVVKDYLRNDTILPPLS